MSVRGLNTTQINWAKKIMARVKGTVSGSDARPIAQMALMTALTESALYMYANRANAASLRLPHDRVGGDHGSVGLFQQQVGGAPNSTANWGTTAQLMDVNISTDKFVNALRRVNWKSMSKGAACQRVQGSAFPTRYAGYEAWAADLLNAYWGGTSASAAPAVGRNITSRPTEDIQELVGVKPDKVYGKDTTAAVKKWQKKNGLIDDGIWGPKSDAKGFPKKGTSKPASKPAKNVTGKAPKFPLPKGAYFGPKSGPKQSVSGYYSHREDLKAWQAQMKERGWDITPDGLYGDQTEGVAKSFQKKTGLRANGLIGPKGWAYAWEHKLVKK